MEVIADAEYGLLRGTRRWPTQGHSFLERAFALIEGHPRCGEGEKSGEMRAAHPPPRRAKKSETLPYFSLETIRNHLL